MSHLPPFCSKCGCEMEFGEVLHHDTTFDRATGEGRRTSQLVWVCSFSWRKIARGTPGAAAWFGHDFVDLEKRVERVTAKACAA